jgi:hypothetical protein
MVLYFTTFRHKLIEIGMPLITTLGPVVEDTSGFDHLDLWFLFLNENQEYEYCLFRIFDINCASYITYII